MEPTNDSRRTENAAAEKTAVTGGNGTEEPAKNGTVRSGAPRSWRQYIEQTLPAKDTNSAAEPREADLLQFAPAPKKRARSAWERFTRRTARWVRETGKKAREKLGATAAVCGKKLGGAAAVCREKMDAATASCEKKLSAAAGLCGKKLGPVVAVCSEKLSPVTAFCREKLNTASAAVWKKLGPSAEKLGLGMRKARAAVARHPISPLLYVTLLAVFIGTAAFQGSYARAYVLEVNGQRLGLVTGEDEANAILGNVETRAASLLGADFDYKVNMTLSPVYAAPGELTDAAELENALLEEVGIYIAESVLADPNGDGGENEATSVMGWSLSVDGVEMGVSASKDELYQMLDEIAQPYLPESAVRYEFVEDVQVYPVRLPLDFRFDDLEPIREELSALRVEEAVYEVKKGDTFNAIARSLDMQPDDLAALNPDIKVDLLSIGQELIIQQAVPRLSVIATIEEIYEETIPSPVEYIETADLYVGDTKVKTQGKDGLALVAAQVIYINNREMAREVLDSTTLTEATTTYTYTGTTPRPTTASKGYFIWPVKGTITSNFGYRYIFGRTDFHGGLDIAVRTGTSVKAADGGTVTKAGWDNSYGYHVLIRHDNGMVTCYAHNSKLLVKAGDKVYQGQIIAKSGSTGNSTGPHCHFEIRVNGTRVNPRPYLN